MKCFYHSQADARGICKNCSKGLCEECAVDVGNALLGFVFLLLSLLAMYNPAAYVFVPLAVVMFLAAWFNYSSGRKFARRD